MLIFLIIILAFVSITNGYRLFFIYMFLIDGIMLF